MVPMNIDDVIGDGVCLVCVTLILSAGELPVM